MRGKSRCGLTIEIGGYHHRTLATKRQHRKRKLARQYSRIRLLEPDRKVMLSLEPVPRTSHVAIPQRDLGA